MGALSPELVDLWLARVFNARDVEAAAAMYPPRCECNARGPGTQRRSPRRAAGMRETMDAGARSAKEVSHA
jgi:hypothetical protein